MDQSQIVYELLVINDGSKDDTGAIAEATGVRVIHHPTNGGYGRALKTGMRFAQYDWCAICDADGSYPIERLPDLIALTPAFDMVVGARTGKHYWGSSSKRVGRLILLRLVQFVVGRYIPDVNSGFRVFNKALALQHAHRISSGFSFTTTLTLAFLLDERFVKYVDVEYLQREGKSKVRIRRDSLRMLQILAQGILYYNPLKLFLLLCMLCMGLGLIMTVLVTLVYSLGQALMLLALTLLATIIVGALGFIAEALRLNRRV
jgi:glycosyltransferase involved in cell wall biosynthesis